MKKFRDFEKAREFVKKLGLKSKKEWQIYCKSSNKPQDIPNWPDAVYKNKGWTSWNDFLGTDYVATFLRKYKLFKEARKYAQSLNKKNQTEWRIFAKSGKLPKDIPRDPPTVYKKEWKGWGDWLRAGKKLARKSNFLPFIEARAFVRKLGLKGQQDWQTNYLKSGNKPNNIPASPQSVYKKEWKGWGDFLGTGNIRDKNFLSFTEAREFVRKLDLASYTEWIDYRKSNIRPTDIPSMPERVYKNKGWRGYGDFLGTGRGSKMIFWEFNKAREFIQNSKIKTKEEYVKFYKSGKLPPEIPKSPPTTYRKYWKGWGDFLGTGNIANQLREYPSMKDAKIEAKQLAIKFNLRTRQDWIKAHREGKIPKHLPANPWHVYAKNKRKKK
jgi:hypothetical protein